MLAPDHVQNQPTETDRIDQLIAAHRPGHGLVRAFYHDQDIYERDLERVFRRHWHCVAHESVIPNVNDFEVLRMASEQVIVTRALDGSIHAMLNVCRRRGAHWQTSQEGREAVHAFRYALYDGASSGSKDGLPVAPSMGRFSDFDGGVTSIHLGGTTFLVCYPDHGMIYRFIPKTAETCEMELIWLVRADAEEGRDYDVEKLIRLWTVTTDEDKAIIEHTARGVRSHYFVADRADGAQ